MIRKLYFPGFALTLLLLIFTCLGTSIASAQSRLYWDFPEIVGSPDGRFPQTVSVGDGLAVVWQDFEGEKGSLDATTSVNAVFSSDGVDWTGPVVNIAENLPYLWLEEVPLFSAASGADGRLVVAISSAREGVAIYRQDEVGGDNFIQADLLVSTEDAADTAVAPRLFVDSFGSYILFLTRRTAVEGASRPTTLTIFASRSDDGSRWTDPVLFIDPEIDQGTVDNNVDGAVLEQNFLPHMLSNGNTDYVAFQSLRQGDQGRVYQIYIKTRTAGGNWSAARAITENLKPNSEIDDPMLWDNQRPHLGMTAEGDILLTFEHRQSDVQPGIAAIALDRNALPLGDTMETVISDRYASSYPQTLNIKDSTWILWFDESGIRMAQRNGSFDYSTDYINPDSQTAGADRDSSTFPHAVVHKGETYLTWQDKAGGRNRIIFLRPDLQVDAPRVSIRNFTVGRPSNRTLLSFSWPPVQDSSGISSYSWLISRDPEAEPSKADIDQVFPSETVDPVNLYDLDDAEDIDGPWYLNVIATDEAGNWSEPRRITYVLDTKPPLPPVLNLPVTDNEGYLLANTFGLSWNDAEAEAAEGYRWRLDWLGSITELITGQLDLSTRNAIAYNDALQSYRDGADFAESANREAVWNNLDNGVWAFSVASRDRAGNVSLSSTTILLARRYIPVTYITDVTARNDTSERTILRIAGRGFSVGGSLTHGMIDRDGEAPWDYEYSANNDQVRVYNDRLAEIIGIEGMEEGTYYIGVRHPVRGNVFWNRRIKLDAGGNVKFGPFGLYKYESLWKPAARLFRISGNELLFVMLLIAGGASLIMAIIRLLSLFRESGKIEKSAKAILAREPLSAEARKQAVSVLRSKGMKLRSKFMLWFTLMVMITILILSVVLGFVWIRMERDSLAQGLESESRLMVETLASTAVTAIPDADRGTLFLLPGRREALPDAMWTTVTGPLSEISDGRLRATVEGYEYVWATDDPESLDKLQLPGKLSSQDITAVLQGAGDNEKEIIQSAYILQADGSFILNKESVRANRAVLSLALRNVGLMPLEIDQGSYKAEDELSIAIEILRDEVEGDIQEAGVGRMITDLLLREAELENESQRIVSTTFNFEDEGFIRASEAVDAQKREIESLLLEVSTGRFASYPEFNTESLQDRDIDSFIFYKPILYRSGTQDVNFFRGTVRLAVSVDGVRNQLDLVQRRIIIITLVAAAAALIMSLFAALGISSLVVQPITLLARKVEEIQTEKDKGNLKDFKAGIKSNDELGALGDSIDEMVKELVQRAKEQEELLAGKEIQKAFLKLDSIKNEKNEYVKMSTGRRSNPFFRLFGYYEGADAVSGDFFGFEELDEDHRAMMKLDISGHGVTAAMIMVQAASLFIDYFRQVREQVKNSGELKYNLKKYIFGLNDLMNEIAFKGRFAAFNLSVINVRTGEYRMNHAGDNIVNIYDPKTGKMRKEELVEAPATGQIDSALIEMKNDLMKPELPKMYESVEGRIEKGEILFLYTDGIEEAHHLLRDENFKEVRYSYFSKEMIEEDKHKFVDAGFAYVLDPAVAGDEGNDDNNSVETDETDETDEAKDSKDPRWEDFETKRINEIIESVMHGRDYTLERRFDLTIGKPLHFQFSKLKPNAENAVLALASVERVFRLVPDPRAGEFARCKVDTTIDDFLKLYFVEYSDFFHHRIEAESGVDYVYFSHLLSDPQDDDLTIWAFERL